jgi:phosphatidylserine decarboxylase
MRLPIAKAGYIYIILSLTVSLVISAAFSPVISFIPWLLTLFIINFFRDPERESLETGAGILAPADGRIIEISESDIPEKLRDFVKISIFMNVFNVHVNRAPCDATVRSIEHFDGTFLPASNSRASLQNERAEIFLDTPAGVMMVRLVAGLIARRIVVYVQPGSQVSRGFRMSMIKFGSRVDLYIPKSIRIEVSVGSKVHAGITRLGTRLQAGENGKK